MTRVFLYAMEAAYMAGVYAAAGWIVAVGLRKAVELRRGS